jgi:molybdopterin-containing oxidoreductase family membrane subunit
LAPRFLASAFVSGPAFIILLLQVIRRGTPFHIGDAPIRTLVQIIRVAMSINLIMLISELFTIFYTGGGHSDAAKYLFFGAHGKHELVPWIWTSLTGSIVGFLLFLSPAVLRRLWMLDLACITCFVGIWIEKGMGLIIPGFVPSTLHEVVEYAPSLTEWKITAGIWAFGLLVLTVILKVAIAVFSNEMKVTERWEQEGSPALVEGASA